MAECSQSAEIEANCDVSIAVQNDRTNMEQKLTLRRTMPEQIILKMPRQLLVGMVEVSQSAKTETSGHVSIVIQKDHTSLEQKVTRPWTKRKQKILRVPHQLLKVNEKAYEPYAVSIGPYHRGKDHLEEMEGQKVRSLKRLLIRANQRVETYLSAMENMVEEARNCYSEPLDISKEEFVDMMVLDGCFIIQFLRRKLEKFCYSGPIYAGILHDLALVENQLPFFVLCKLLDMIPRSFFNLEGSADPRSWLISNLLKKFESKMLGLRVDKTYDIDSMKNVEHIVHLLVSNWLPSDNAMAEYAKQSKVGKWNYMRPATELREAGIKFEKVKTTGSEKWSIFDIKFEKGILEMPPVRITNPTESLYRNLLAFEQCHYNKDNRFLTDYVALMDSLIDSGKDVELLCQRGIIDNWLGDDEAVAVLFNRLGVHINLSRERFFYAQLFQDINKHYEEPWNAWMANLRHKYFNTPWALISFLAATLLVLLTVMQTTFAIFPRS